MKINDYKTLSDAELITYLKASDHAAYTEIYHRYSSLLYVHAVKKLNDSEQAEDMVQELFAKLWINREGALTATNLGGYLYTLLKNRILDFFGHEQVKTKYVDSIRAFMDRNTSPRTDGLILEKELNAQIDKEIQALAPKMREIFLLSRKEQLSYKEIAAQLHTNENNVARQVNIVVKKLRSRLSIISTCYLILLLFFK